MFMKGLNAWLLKDKKDIERERDVWLTFFIKSCSGTPDLRQAKELNREKGGGAMIESKHLMNRIVSAQAKAGKGLRCGVKNQTKKER